MILCQGSILFEEKTPDPRLAILLRLPPPNISQTPEVRVAVVGNVDAGKSSFLGKVSMPCEKAVTDFWPGVLTRGALDDGRGRARVGLFRHKHEIETGRTSSVGMEVRCPVFIPYAIV
jgi:GTPase